MSSPQFIAFAKAVRTRFEALSKSELYEVVMERDELFENYLKAFPEGTNPIFRVRTEHDGSYDRGFIRNLGHVIALDKNGKYQTLWDIPNLPTPYDVVAAALHAIVISRQIATVFRTKESRFSHEKNVELKDGVTITFHHFNATIDSKHRTNVPDQIVGRLNTNLAVFKRGVTELTNEAISTVEDLIASNGLYRGAEHSTAIAEFKKLKKGYDKADNKSVFLWQNIGNNFGLFRNTVIGTLVTDISEGVDLDKAVRMFEMKVAPANYKRASAVITPKMIENAIGKLKELGLEGAVKRRHATVEDIDVKDVLFVDNSVRGKMKNPGDLTELLMSSAAVRKGASFKTFIDITGDDFLSKIVPSAEAIALLVENRHLNNFMTLTAPIDGSTGKLFKWDNDFAWSYDGDVTDGIRERVKEAGGNVDAPLRVSLRWHCADDLDLHAQCPEGHVYYSQKKGVLDVDMNGIDRHDANNPVENLSWTRPKDGHYTVYVNQYNRRSNDPAKYGFDLQFVFNGETKTYRYPGQVSGTVGCLEFDVKNGMVTSATVDKKLLSENRPQGKWGITTTEVVPVDTLLLSPNYWNGQAVGNQHLFFILKDAKNPDDVRGIYNEFLRGDLNEHRKVFEVLGSKTKVPYSENQMSGIGFSSTRKDTAFVVVTTNGKELAYKVSF